jgi:hypothetical protein
VGPLTGGDAGNGDVNNEANLATTFVRPITITNTAQGPLPIGYTIGVAFDDADLQAAIAAGKIRSDLGDLRVHGPSGECDRIIDDPPLARVVWFSLAAPIPAGATDTTYELTYGVPDAGAPPANGSAVFSCFDDFDGTTLDPRWLTTGGTFQPNNGTLTLASGQSDSLTTAVPQDPQTTVEIRAQVTNPASSDGSGDPSSYMYWLGFQRTGDFDASPPWELWLSSAVSTIGAVEQADGCSSTCTSANVPQTSAFRVYGIERPPVQSIYSLDGAVAFTLTSSINDQPLSIMIRNFLVDSDIVLDWVRSHTRIYPEPTVALGPEQPG